AGARAPVSAARGGDFDVVGSARLDAAAYLMAYTRAPGRHRPASARPPSACTRPRPRHSIPPPSGDEFRTVLARTGTPGRSATRSSGPCSAGGRARRGAGFTVPDGSGAAPGAAAPAEAGYRRDYRHTGQPRGYRT